MSAQATTEGRYHLNLSLMQPGHFRTAWRLPGHDPLAVLDIEYFARITEHAERAKLHTVFLGDGPGATPAIAGAPEAGIDPTILFANLFARTSRIGAIATSSTTYNEPYNLARRYSALDHVSGGRTAFNAVTTLNPTAAAAFGYDREIPKAERYERAEEFFEIVTALWGAWEDGAIVADAESGVFADVSRIHPIDFEGRHFRVRGNLSLPESPQGRPLIVQAGGSAGGIRLGARFADIVFTVAQTKTRAREFRRELAQAALAVGRATPPQTSLGVVLLIGSTEEEARRRGDELLDTLGDQAGDRLLAQLGIPVGSIGPDDLITRDLVDAQALGKGSDGFNASTLALLDEQSFTTRELLLRSAAGNGHRLVLGTPEQIADDLDSWFDAGTADGFTVMSADNAVDAPAFLDEVVPILQRRGSFRTEYQGDTLRENFGLPFPEVRRAAS
ncbi:NtaA/DmoA family FMN-dependent monooxygenase [Microbacterium sp.]|uniref:NtaA/DmoA family FMN-dependent monooxygenase n=1 Tax=Microbacterium sp. TaxID=51671 RepID=UPI0039E62AB0